ncbi:MAG: TIGR04255 family protein, partial [Spirochaetaceae bacterium]|nr:TIGR04255 family protein [Spirochaetaceae bacterium]
HPAKHIGNEVSERKISPFFWPWFITEFHKFNRITVNGYEKNIIDEVERIALRTYDVLEGNIFGRVNAELTVNGNTLTSTPSSFYTEFDQNNTHVVLNVSNAAIVNGRRTENSLIDIDCTHDFNCDSNQFFVSYKEALENAHTVNKQVFFGLLKEDLVKTYNPEYGYDK